MKAGKKTMYKVNDIVVYRRDVCKIVGRHRSDFTGEMCYDLVPYSKQDGSVKMQVPVSNKAGNLRDLITEDEIRELIISAPDIQTLENKPANMKSQYAALLKGNDIEDLICIIKTSYGRNKARMEQHKKLASIDDEYLQKAENYLYQEISVALGKTYDEAKAYFEDEVAKLAEE
jgi:CarD family transcriptional regulator